MRAYENEPIVVQREVKAVAYSAAAEVNLKLGQVGYITQALGGSFTVYIDGNLFRIAGHDADAIGKTSAKPPEVPPGASEEDIKNIIWQQLKTCYDPEIPVNIVDLGLVYECDVSKNADSTRTVDIKMTLTAPGCGMGEVLVQDVRDKVQIIPTVARANVELVFDPPWNQTMMSDEARLQTGMMRGRQRDPEYETTPQSVKWIGPEPTTDSNDSKAIFIPKGRPLIAVGRRARTY